MHGKKLAILECFVGGGNTWFCIPLPYDKHIARATAYYNGILQHVGSIRAGVG